MADYPVSIELVRRKLLEMRDGMEPNAIAVLNMALSKLEGFPAMDQQAQKILLPNPAREHVGQGD